MPDSTENTISALQDEHLSLDEPLYKEIPKTRRGTVSLFKDRVVLLALIATVTACGSALQPSFLENKMPTRKAIWDILVAIGGLTATLVLQYAGDEKFNTPSGLPGRDRTN